MFILFHVFVPLLFYELIIRIRTSIKFSRMLIIIGSMLPDLIDKPLSLLGFTSGRGYAHTPFILIILLVVMFLFTKNKIIVVSIGFGVIFHLLLDIPCVPWLWPIIPIKYYHSYVDSWFYSLFHDPVVMITELMGLFGLLWLSFSYKLYNMKNMKNYLIDYKQIQK